jgi:hypothetical protein
MPTVSYPLHPSHRCRRRIYSLPSLSVRDVNLTTTLCIPREDYAILYDFIMFVECLKLKLCFSVIRFTSNPSRACISRQMARAVWEACYLCLERIVGHLQRVGSPIQVVLVTLLILIIFHF